MIYHQALRRLAKTMQVRTDALPTTSAPYGVVTTVDPTGASDGGPLATVALDSGTTLQIGYLAPYTPVAGDRVRVLNAGGYPLILGRVAGLPSY